NYAALSFLGTVLTAGCVGDLILYQKLRKFPGDTMVLDQPKKPQFTVYDERTRGFSWLSCDYLFCRAIITGHRAIPAGVTARAAAPRRGRGTWRNRYRTNFSKALAT